MLLLWTPVVGQTVHKTASNSYKKERLPCSANKDIAYARLQSSGKTYRVKCSLFCSGKYEVADTVADQKLIYLYQNRLINIQLTSPDESIKNIVVSKSLFSGQLNNAKGSVAVGRDWENMLLGTTRITVSQKNKQFVVTTFMGYPDSDYGILLKYALYIDGTVKFLRLAEADMGM
ncbi:hypothetical protein [Hymenobacter rigui]|uniref:Uncharacterized protein n=1 Tax=Hymenobacter rigui TaxID=334424 RepID=A0A3R9N5A1_9BACT|nr:hypothetical protein [Hymenobacter rigui]RSK48558.1 hypothetical protein EI291_12645 [Hymenobacter rigui]